MIDRIFLSGMQKIAELSAKRYDVFGNILMFHQVSDDKASWLFPEFAITRNSFQLVLDKITEAGIKLISIDGIEESVKKRERFLCITFDDGYQDTYSEAFPILREKNIPFAVFVTTSFLGREHYLTKEQVKELAADPLCTVGSHSATHPMTRKLSIEQKKQEYSESKKLLEDIIGKSVDYLAYPYGSYFACGTKGDADLLKDAGYKAAFSTVNAPVNDKTAADRYFLPRRNMGGPDVERRLDGILR